MLWCFLLIFPQTPQNKMKIYNTCHLPIVLFSLFTIFQFLCPALLSFALHICITRLFTGNMKESETSQNLYLFTSDFCVKAENTWGQGVPATPINNSNQVLSYDDITPRCKIGGEIREKLDIDRYRYTNNRTQSSIKKPALNCSAVLFVTDQRHRETETERKGKTGGERLN